MMYAGVIGFERSCPSDTLRCCCAVIGVQSCRSAVDPTRIRHGGRNGVKTRDAVAVLEIQRTAADGIHEAEAHSELHFLSFDELTADNEVAGSKIGFDKVCHFVARSGILHDGDVILHIFRIIDMRSAETQCHAYVPVRRYAILGANSQYRILRKRIELFLNSHTTGDSTVNRCTGLRLNGQLGCQTNRVERDTNRPIAHLRLVPFLRLLVLRIQHRNDHHHRKKR